MKRSGKISFALTGMAACITFLVYLPALQNAFVGVWDDNAYVAENQHIRSFDLAFLRWAFSTTWMGNWNPLTWISHAVDYAVWGLNPLGHHLTSIILHAVNTGLVVLLVMRLLQASREEGSRGTSTSFLNDRTILIAAGVTGLLFGIHPVHVESVAWVAERKDLLCALFFLGSIITYTEHAIVRHSAISGQRSAVGSISSVYYLTALGLFVLALLSKPMAVTLPVVLLILDWHPFGKIRSLKTLWHAVKEKMPFLALTLIFSILSVIAQRSGGALLPVDRIPLAVRLLVAPSSLAAYLGKMLFPMKLIPFYPYPKSVALFSFAYGAALLFAIGVTVVCIVVAKKQKVWLSAWAYYVITLAPVIGVVQVGNQAMADRYTYLPSLGPFLIAGVCAAWIVERARTRYSKHDKLVVSFALIASIGVLLVLSGMTMRQIGIWKNGFTLWDHAIAEGMESSIAYNNRGLSLEEQGEWNKALADFEHAILMDPENYFAYNNRGVLYGREGDYQRSIEYFQKAIAINPKHADAYCNLGLSYFNLHQYRSALDSYDKAIALKPDFGTAYLDRGNLHFIAGDKQLAVADYQKACSLGNGNACEALHLATEALAR